MLLPEGEWFRLIGMTMHSTSQEKNLETLRDEYRGTFRVMASETSRLQCLLELDPYNTAALVEARCRVEEATRRYRQARNILAAEVLRDQARNKSARKRDRAVA
jgi:hypothetical protein